MSYVFTYLLTILDVIYYDYDMLFLFFFLYFQHYCVNSLILLNHDLTRVHVIFIFMLMLSMGDKQVFRLYPGVHLFCSCYTNYYYTLYMIICWKF